MTVPSTLSGLTLTVLLGFHLAACGQSSQSTNSNRTEVASAGKALFDTSKTAVIGFDKKGNYPFDNACKPANLTHAEIQTVDSLLIETVKAYNSSLDKANKQFSIDLSERDYKKQLIAVTNENGDKEVWINCFCSTWDRAWRKDVLIVKDGGNCYFNFKINLTKMSYYNMAVNSEA